MKRTLVWFRGKDLRVEDHLPLVDAAAAGEVIPLFVIDPFFFSPKRAAQLPNRLTFLLGSLRELQRSLERLGSKLVLAEGKSVELVPRLAQRWKVDQVFAHRWVEPFGRERDARVAAALRVPLVLYEGETLLPPGAVRTGAGTPFKVFSAFARAQERLLTPRQVVAAPRGLPPLPRGIAATNVSAPTPRSLTLSLAASLPEPGEAAARRRLARFVDERLDRYGSESDQMDLDSTSRLSADLKFGTLSIVEVWNAVQSNAVYANELRWREFSHHVLWNRPEVLREPFQPAWAGFPWRHDERLFSAWAQGRTGYPVVDAASRQLLGEGFVHNRARMISASFLTKHLLIDFRLGEAHYLKHLVDGDWAQNDLNWQWAAGCGCDAQPYFRVFNPEAQGERFDPDGEYVRRWVPEFGSRDYPKPIVDHREARARFLTVAKQHLWKQRLAQGRPPRSPAAAPERAETSTRRPAPGRRASPSRRGRARSR